MSIQTITAKKAAELLQQGAVFIDIRGDNEYMHEHIRGARHITTDALNPASLTDDVIVFYCTAGKRTALAQQTLDAAATRQAYILEGGIEAWKQAGMPVMKSSVRPIPSQPPSLQRQVLFIAGAVVFSGTLLGVYVSPWFFIIPAFVGCALMFAGAVGFCLLAQILKRMPWNQSKQPHQINPASH